MWPSNEEIAYYKRIGNNETATDEYYNDMLQLVLEHVNEECVEQFTPPDLPANVKLFLAQSIAFFYNMEPGLKSESVSSVSYSFDFSQLPVGITGLLGKYGYGSKRNYAKFHAW